jgi:hypothetical protein
VVIREGGGERWEVTRNAQERTTCVWRKVQAPAARRQPAYGSDDLPSLSTKLAKNVCLAKTLSAPVFEVPHVQYLSKSSGYIASKQTAKRQYRASSIKGMDQPPAGNMHAPVSSAMFGNRANSQTPKSRTLSKTWLP